MHRMLMFTLSQDLNGELCLYSQMALLSSVVAIQESVWNSTLPRNSFVVQVNDKTSATNDVGLEGDIEVLL